MLLDSSISYEVAYIRDSNGTVIDYNLLPLYDAKEKFFEIAMNKLVTTIASEPQAYIDFMPTYTNNIMLNKPGDSISLSKSALLSEYSEGCGAGIMEYIVPDHPFYQACVQHDYCYSSSSSKLTCDNQFFNNMLSISFDRANQFNDVLLRLVKLAAHVAMARLYYEAVDRFGLYFWCNSTTNEQKAAMCNPELPPVGPGNSGQEGAGTYSSSSGSFECIDWVEYGNTTADGLYCEGWAYRP